MSFPTVAEFQEYINKLNRHDWFYDYSDDHSVWRSGLASAKEIMNQSKEHPIYDKAYKAYQACAFGYGEYPYKNETKKQTINALMDELKSHYESECV